MSSKYIKIISILSIITLNICIGIGQAFADEHKNYTQQQNLSFLLGDNLKKSVIRQKVSPEPLSEKLYYGNKNILIIGDSLAVGWDGKQVLSKNYPFMLNKILKPKSLDNSFSSSGSQISGNSNGKPIFDLSNNVSRILKGNNIKHTDIVIIELGVNDLNYSNNNLGYVQQRLQSNIQRLRNANPKIKIFGILPVASFIANKKSNYSIIQLKRSLADVYSSFGIPVLDVNTLGIANSSSDLGDKLVHPTKKTYKQIAFAAGNWMKNDYIMSTYEHNGKKNFKSDGWQTNESNELQFAINNVLQSDYHEIDGKRYYFDPKTKKLIKNENVKFLGKEWYADKQGKLFKR